VMDVSWAYAIPVPEAVKNIVNKTIDLKFLVK